MSKGKLLNIWHKFRFDQKKLLPVLTTGLLLLGLVAALYLAKSSQEIRKKASYAQPSLSLIPTSASQSTGSLFNLAVSLNTGDETVSGVYLHLTYDPQVLEAQNIIPGQYLPVILKSGQTGGGSITLSVGSDAAHPQKGTGVIASASFKVIASKNTTTQVNFASDTKVAAIGKKTNVLGNSTGSSINITGIPAVTITNTPSTPTPRILTPTPTRIPSLTPTRIPTPTSISSAFCNQVRANIGAKRGDAKWNVAKQYDLNADGIINGLDVIVCNKTKK